MDMKNTVNQIIIITNLQAPPEPAGAQVANWLSSSLASTLYNGALEGWKDLSLPDTPKKIIFWLISATVPFLKAERRDEVGMCASLLKRKLSVCTSTVYLLSQQTGHLLLSCSYNRCTHSCMFVSLDTIVLQN